jgi:RimJ/RimL family protein N-acetyltransferase
MRLEDLQAWVEWFRASGPERLTCRPLREFDVPSMLQRHQERSAAGEAGFFAVRRLEDGVLLGRVAWFDHNPRNRSVEIGFVIAPKQQGLGYAYESVGLLLGHLFADRALNKVMAQTGAFNEGSLRLLKRLGFREDGRLRRHHLVDGVLHDDVLLSLLAEEFGELS